MAASKYVCNAKFVGRQTVKGPFSDSSLSEVVSELRSKLITQSHKGHDDLRCNLEFYDRSLLITYIKKDEGFESDGESTSTTMTNSGAVNGESVDNVDGSAAGVDIKIIKDHVFGYDSQNNETSSLDETSGADSGDDFAQVRKPSSCSTASTSTTSSPSASPTAELQKYKFDRKESFPITDVLICHTDKKYLSCVVWVVRTPGGGPGSGGSLEALVFECSGEESVKELYRNFLEVSKKSKFERHRRRKSDGFSGVDEKTRQQFGQEQHLPQNGKKQQHNGLWNLVRHTDRNGITHIEVESQKKGEKVLSPRKPSEKSKFAKELETILSKELESRRNEGRAMGSASPASPSKVWGPRTGEPQSLRQRAPALLLRKLDEFEEMAQRVWGGTPPDGENDHENRKIWQKSEPSKAACRTPPPTSRRLQELDGRRRERLERLRVELMQQKSEESNESGNKSTPVLTTTSSTSATITTTTTTTSALKKDVEKQILIPTKTGKEPVKKLYPKDSPPDHLRARFVPVAIPIQFATGQQFSTQPLSLPLYPIQVAPVGWARYPGDFNDPNNNLNQIARAQWAAARVPVEGVPAREGRGRSRDRPDGESRRRAQSKSPARRPAANYLDNVAYDMSELSKKFREFGDAVRQRMSRKSGPPTSAGPQPQPVGDGAQLKSNLKKQRESVGVTVNGASQSIHHHGHDNKKVHFNKFATVQMME